MGEYAKVDGFIVKIGTCEDMYYLRYEDRTKVKQEPNNIEPKRVKNLRYRLPFPDEDRIQIGNYNEYDRAAPLRKVHEDPYERYEYYSEPQIAEWYPGTIQLRHECGLLINVPCYHGERLPDLGLEGKAFWNGKKTFIALSSVKELEDGTLIPILRCICCENMWRSEWEKVLPWVMDVELRKRLTAYSKIGRKE